ncbi:MAG: DUF3786 domain-containing protein [Desulfobacteraceae bacterium]|nr:DUF3786 domain-containing protein [Desulfobacteraceae bacterium]
MALSVVDLYTRVLPRTNCKDCGYPTCLAFAGMVVSQRHPLKNCPHIHADILSSAQKELEAQYKQGKWLKKDMAEEALEWAKQKTASMKLEDIAARIGGIFMGSGGDETILVSCFNKQLSITRDGIRDDSGRDLSRNEQTFVYIHLARGGTSAPSGNMKSLKEFPNTISKIVSMRERVEIPLKKAFSANPESLSLSCENFGGANVKDQYPSCDLAYEFKAFPKVPVVLLFWKAADGFEADAKLLFDETIIQHLDIEAILFLSEHLCNMLIH